MEVILLQDVKKLGNRGDVVKVADGYARNFLLPRGIAVEASEGKKKEWEITRSAMTKKQQSLAEEARKLAERLGSLKVHVPAKVGEKGKLFGAVSGKDIALALEAEHGITVDKKKIVIDEPIKGLGEYILIIKLHQAVQASLKVEVVPE